MPLYTFNTADLRRVTGLEIVTLPPERGAYRSRNPRVEWASPSGTYALPVAGPGYAPVMISFGTLETPVGTVGVTSDGAAITHVSWRAQAPPEAAGPADDVLVAALGQLTAYFEGRRRTFDVPVRLGAQTDATRAVLTCLFDTVGYGETVTYGELAARSGTGIPARGIGAVMGANPIPIIVPCHRVLAGDGLGGYSGGAPGKGRWTKRWLLELEGALPAPLF